MRLQISRFNPEEKEYVLPSSKNYRRIDVLILKLCIVFALLAIAYSGPYRLMQPVHETSGCLQSVERAYTAGTRHTHKKTKGLHLTVDNQMYYLDGKYIFNDRSYYALRDIPAMLDGLSKKENQTISISYLHYMLIGSETDLSIVGLEIDDKTWIDTDRSMEMFQKNARIQTAIWALVLAALIVTHHIRKNYTITIC